MFQFNQSGEWPEAENVYVAQFQFISTVHQNGKRVDMYKASDPSGPWLYIELSANGTILTRIFWDEQIRNQNSID